MMTSWLVFRGIFSDCYGWESRRREKSKNLYLAVSNYPGADLGLWRILPAQISSHRLINQNRSRNPAYEIAIWIAVNPLSQECQQHEDCPAKTHDDPSGSS